MKAEILPNPQSYLKELPDSRRETKNKLHELEDILIDVKSNEITAIPTLLELLDIQGAAVTNDAMGCQKTIAKRIVEGGADYVLALKDNHPTLHEDITLWLDSEINAGQLPVLEIEKDHGRIEKRGYWLSDRIDWLEYRGDWRNLNAVGRVERSREIYGKVSIERSEFLCSFADLEKFSRVVRGHWGIENQQHWVLDIYFEEDKNRTRTDHAPENLALMRRIALNLIRCNGTGKRSIRRHRNKAMANDQYRQQLQTGTT